MKQSLAAYIPMDRRQALVHGRDLPDRSSGAALFADLSGFTQLTNTLARELGPQRGAEEISRHLNQIFTALITEVHGYRGAVIGFAGDAITCWFDDDGRWLKRTVGSEQPSAGQPSAALRAVACALAMQRAMTGFASLHTPGGSVVVLAMRVSVNVGPVRRFVVGTAQIQFIDVLAGETVYRLADVDHVSDRGEVVVSSEVVAALGHHAQIATWRTDDAGQRFAVIAGLNQAPLSDPWPELPLDQITEIRLRPWLLPPVYARLRDGQGQFLAELRPAVALFLRFEGIDYDEDAAAGNKLDAYIQWAQRIVTRYDGSLLQLSIGDKGSYFYCAFGAPLAHEDDAVRAARAALLLRTPPAELSFIRSTQIGISLGRMRTGAYGSDTRLTYGVIGDEVNIAARLMQAVSPGQICVSQQIQQAAAKQFVWEQLPPLSVKGRTEPLSAFHLLSARERQPVHVRNTIYALPLVGRNGELALINARLTEAIGGQGRIVAVTAEAGLGKSRLMAEALRMALDRGMTVYSGEAQSFGTNDSYLAWEGIWQDFFAVDMAAPVEDQIARLHDALAAIDPALLPRLPLLGVVFNLPIPDNDLTRSMDSRLRKISLEALFVTCLRLRSKAHPLLITIEDTHWMDSLSYELLEAIGRAIVDLPVCIMLAYRPADVSTLWTQRVTDLPHCSVIELGELSAQEAADLIQLKLIHLDRPGEMSSEMIDWLIARTQGNPFFIEELLRYLDGLEQSPQSLAGLQQLDVPEVLYSLVLSRIDQLSERQKTTLKVASVIGRHFRDAWLWGVHPQLGTPGQVRADLHTLNQIELTLLEQLEPDPAYLFKHIMTHGVAYESLPFETRAWLHEQVAGYIEHHYKDALEPYIDLLAFHYDQSTNQAKRREYLARAAEAAHAAYANTAAIDYYRRLLLLLEDAQRGPTLLRLGQVLELVGEWAEAGTCYRQALALAEAAHAASLAVECRRATGWLARKQADYPEALRWLEQARSDFVATGDMGAAIQTLADIGEVYRLQGDYAQARTCYQQGLELAAHAESTPELLVARANALKGAGTLANQQGELDLARMLYAESLAIRRQLNDQPGIAAMLNNLGMAALFREDFVAAEPLFAESLALFRQIGDRWAMGQLLNNLGLVMRYNGDIAAARRILEESIAVRRNLGDKWGIANSLSTLTNLLLHEGYATGLAEMLRESLELNKEVGDQVALAYCLEDYAGLAAVEGRHQRALHLAGAAAALRAELGAPLPPTEQASLDRLLATAVMTLGPAANTAYAAGQALSLDDTLALVVS